LLITNGPEKLILIEKTTISIENPVVIGHWREKAGILITSRMCNSHGPIWAINGFSVLLRAMHGRIDNCSTAIQLND
jgi:hypothetical protein